MTTIPYRLDIQSATPASARDMINAEVFPLSDKNAPVLAKKEFARLRSTMLAVVDALPKQGLLISFFGGGFIGEDASTAGNLSWSTTSVAKNLFSMYSW